jgi:hypothetical protein
MHDFATTPRRGFLARLAGAAAALTAGSALPAGALMPQAGGPDRWLAGLTGKHRCLFDFPLHGDGLPLIHIYNYINTYKTAYGEPASAVSTVGTLYGAPGSPASLPLAFNDTMWEKYRFGEMFKLNDPSTAQPTRRNMFARPRSGDPVFFGGAMAIASLENMQRLGTVFLLCNNSLLAWVGFLSGSGSTGNPADIERDLRANLLPGVITVPAMVIAIEKAQAAGIAYNRQ